METEENDLQVSTIQDFTRKQALRLFSEILSLSGKEFVKAPKAIESLEFLSLAFEMPSLFPRKNVKTVESLSVIDTSEVPPLLYQPSCTIQKQGKNDELTPVACDSVKVGEGGE